MASSFSVSKYTGTNAGTENTAMSYMHLINDVAAVANTATAYQDSTNQITVPTSGTAYSAELWVKGKWGGTYNSITNVKFWKSAGTLGTGVSILFGKTATGATPVNTASTVATGAIPTADTDAAAAVTVSGAAPNTVTDFIVLQLNVQSTASPGDVGSQTYSFKWTES